MILVLLMLEVTEIPVSKNDHPSPPHPLLKHEFTMSLIAPKGAGKTTLLINLLKFYKGYFHKIIIFSPTVNNDEKWKYAKSLKLLAENKELKKIIAKAKKKEAKSILNPNGKRPQDENVPYDPPRFLKDLGDEEVSYKKFDGKIPDEFFMAEYSGEDLDKIVDQQQEMVEFLEENGYTKHKADRLLFIFDDMVGSNLFTSKRQDPFKKLNTKHRHLSASILMVTQGHMEIPKTIRTQFSGLIIFKISNVSERDVIIKEFPMGFDKETWISMYRECTEKKHSFMYINTLAPEGEQILCNFSYIVGNKYKKQKLSLV